MTDLKQIEKWADRKDENQHPLEFYIEHREQYPPDLTRSWLSRIDSGLYKSLLRHGELEQAIPEADESAVAMGRKIGKWSHTKHAYKK